MESPICLGGEVLAEELGRAFHPLKEIYVHHEHYEAFHHYYGCNARCTIGA